MAIVDGHIRCPRCGESKPLEAFAPAIARRGRGECRACKNARNREYDERNREYDERNRDDVRQRSLAWVDRLGDTAAAIEKVLAYVKAGTQAPPNIAPRIRINLLGAN